MQTGSGTPVSTRAGAGVAVSGRGMIAGYASVFAQQDQQGDVMAPGAFADSLRLWQRRGKWPALLWQHDAGRPVGAITRLFEDRRGLWLEGRLSLESAGGMEAWALLKDGALDGLSVGFRTLTATRGKQGTRLLTRVDLWEVSLVTFPANPAARVVAVKGDVVLGG